MAFCEKLPYLKNLGVTALYLNPVFYAAPSVASTTRKIIASRKSAIWRRSGALRLRRERAQGAEAGAGRV